MTQATFHSEHHRRLDVLAGAWETTLIALQPDGSTGGVSFASDVYTWMPNGHFLVHEVDAMMDGQRVRSTEIIGVDVESGGFFSRSYDADGGTSDFTSRLDGGRYTIQGQSQRFDGVISSDRQLLTGEWEHRVGDDWIPFVRIVLERAE